MKLKFFFSESSLFRISLSLILLFFLLYLCLKIPAQNISKEEAEEKKIVEVLKKTSEYCRKLENAALDFICLEEISERIDLSRDMVPSRSISLKSGSGSTIMKRVETIKNNKYKYDYQLIRKANEIIENRILLEENFQKKFKKNANLQTEIFTFNKFLFGAVGVLSEERQNYYDYKIINNEILNDEKIVLIEAIPKPSLTQKIIFGKIWVRENDYSILKIEWNQKSIINFFVLEQRAKRYKADPEITTITEYGFEKNTIRFPSKCFIEEAYKNKKGEKFVRSETTAIYKDYKFFTVETEIRFK